jgi:hypothetical protein
VSLLAGAGSAAIEVAPTQDSALMVLPESGLLAWLHLDGTAKTPVPVAGAMAGVDRIAFSPSGTAAILYSSASRRAQTLTGLPAEPAVALGFDLSSLQGSVSAIAINDGGDTVLAALATDSTALYALTASSAPARVYSAAQIGSVAFLRNSHDAILSAPVENRVIWLQNAANAIVVADSSAGISAPLAAMPSQDGSRAFAVNRNGAVWSIPLSGAQATRVSCTCQPTQLQRMRGTDVFLLTASLDQPLAVLDAGGQSLQIDFVPLEPPLSARAAAGDSIAPRKKQ